MKPELANRAAQLEWPAHPVERQTYTIDEAAKILGICRAVAYRKGVLPTVQIGGRRLVPKRALDRMLAGETPTPDLARQRAAQVS